MGGVSNEQPKHPVMRRNLKWVVGGLLVVVLAVEVVLVWPELRDGVVSVRDASWWWLAAAVVASIVSMTSMASVQRVLLGVAGVKVRQRQSVQVVFAANSMSVTLPGGPIISMGFTFRETRKWGANAVVASWQLVMAGALQAIGLAAVGIAGTMLVGAANNPFSLLFSAAALFAVIVLAQYAASRPDALEGVSATALRLVNRARKLPDDHGRDRLHSVIAQIGAVRMTRADSARAAGWSLFNWICDAACLAFAAYAVGGSPSLGGLAVAYAASNAARTAIPLLPAGLGVMEVVLVPALAASGLSGGQALSAVIVYRFVSFLMVAIIGWVIFAMRFRGSLKASKEEGEQVNEEPPNFLG